MSFFLLFLLSIPTVVACQRAASQSEPRIIEQSRRERPDWINTPISHPTVTVESNEYHAVKSKVMDLPLGLRQAEASALNDTKLMIEDEILLFWKKDKLFQLLDSSDRSLIIRHLEKLLEVRMTPSLITDIYFEKIFDPNAVMALQETYTIHIRIVLDREEMRRLLGDLRDYCRSSMRQGLIQLAQRDQIFSTQP